MSPRLAVYTVLIGDKEPLGNPLAQLAARETDLEIDFICFTDNRELRSDVWQFRIIDSGHLPPEKLSRRPKALPHEYLAEYEFSLYIDNIVTFKRLPRRADLTTTEPYLLRVFRHATRRNPGEEADAIVMLGYDEAANICRQLDFYARLRPIETITPLSTCTVILRSHNHPNLVRFGVTWWEHILNFSKRDQMSFDFAVHHAGCRTEAFPGLKHDNDLIHNANNLHQDRVKANFDATRYAWRNRHDPAAQQNPQRHFLAAADRNDAPYARRVSLLDYICHKTRSSLGSLAAPRRCVADTLQWALSAVRERGGQFLSVRIRDTAGESFLDEELGPAEAALVAYLFRHKGSSVGFDAADFAADGTAFHAGNLRYNVVVVFGLPPARIAAVAQRLGSLLDPDTGVLVVLSSGQAAAGDIAAQEQQLTKRLGAPCRAAVSSSEHDNLAEPIANSVIAFRWPAAS